MVSTRRTAKKKSQKEEAAEIPESAEVIATGESQKRQTATTTNSDSTSQSKEGEKKTEPSEATGQNGSNDEEQGGVQREMRHVGMPKSKRPWKKLVKKTKCGGFVEKVCKN